MTKNHGLTPLEKYQIFDFFNFVILGSKNAFFLSRISTKTFSWPIKPKIKDGKNSNFWPNYGLTPLNLEKCWFFYFFNFLILESKNAFFLSRISSNTFYWLILPKMKRLFRYPSHPSHPSYISYLITLVTRVTPVISVISST